MATTLSDALQEALTKYEEDHVIEIDYWEQLVNYINTTDFEKVLIPSHYFYLHVMHGLYPKYLKDREIEHWKCGMVFMSLADFEALIKVKEEEMCIAMTVLDYTPCEDIPKTSVVRVLALGNL